MQPPKIVNIGAKETDYDNFVKNVPQIASSVEIDPVAKVAQWQQNKTPIQQGKNFCKFFFSPQNFNKF